MANQNAKQVDVLGFDRMEIANVRRSYAANKVNYTKLNKLCEKAAAIKAQVDAITEQIKTWDAPARALALEKVGVELSSEEILLAHTEPEKFFEMHPELRRVAAVDVAQEPAADAVNDEGAHDEGAEEPAHEPTDEGPMM